VFDLVVSKHLTETQFDTFTFGDCLAICRAMGGKSKRQLSGEEVAAVVTAKPDSFDAELNSIYETGMTVEEAEAQAKAEADRKAQAEEAAKAAEAERLRLAAEEAARQKLAAEQAAQAAAAATSASATPPAAAPAPSAPVPAPVPATPAPAASTAPVEDDAAPSEETEPTPPPAASAPVPVPPPATPANITPMPGVASTDTSAADEILSALDEITLAALDLDLDGRKEVFAKLNECMATLSDSIHTNPPIAA
jgi:chemotaxis protein histidine kinase CheA